MHMYYIFRKNTKQTCLQTDLPVAVVDHDVVGLYVSVHDAHTVAVVESSQQLVQIVADVVVCQLLVQSL